MKTKRENKAARREALRDRLRAAQADIYGNARTPWADDVPGFASFYDWLGDYAQREAEYMTGDRFGLTERETAAPRWWAASQRLDEARRKHPTPRYDSQVIHEAKNNHAFPCGPFESEHAALLRDGVGKCYSAGRNGKTFYPEAYAADRQGFSVRDVADDLSADALTDAVAWLEQFNAYVRSVAAGAPDAYRDEAADALRDKAADLRDAISTTRADFAKLAGELRALRGIDAPTACDVLRVALVRMVQSVHADARRLRKTINALRDIAPGVPA